MDSILTPYEDSMLVAHVYPSANSLKDAFPNLEVSWANYQIR